MKKQEQQDKEWEENYYPETANELKMPGDFFEQQIPSDPCEGCRKRDEIIKAQDKLIEDCIGLLELLGRPYTGNKSRAKIEQLKNQL